VTISINKGDYTITKSTFTYYLNTRADQCIAYGPGLLNENCPDVDTVIMIQARNNKGFNRESGDDEFIIKITLPESETPQVVKKPIVKQENEEGEEGQQEE